MPPFPSLYPYWPSTASPVEVLWTLISVAGAIRWLQRYLVSVRQRARINVWDGELAADRIVLDIRCMRAIMIVDCLLAFAGIGVIVLMLPDGPITTPIRPLSWGFAALAFFVPTMLVLKGEIFDARERALVALVRGYQQIMREKRG